MRNNDLIKHYNLFKLFFMPKITTNIVFCVLNGKKLHLMPQKTSNTIKIVFYYLIMLADGAGTVVLYPCNRTTMIMTIKRSSSG